MNTETNTRAIVALVLGIGGLIVLPVVLSIPAIVVGNRARREIDASGGRQGGRGLAVAGIVCGWIGVALALLGLLAIVLLGVALTD